LRKLQSISLWIVFLVLPLLLDSEAAAKTYTTSFPLTENPISEGGKWINGGSVGLKWSNVSTTPGLAIGHQPGNVHYTDATALLTGNWAPNQTAQATVHVGNTYDNDYPEVELRLRSSLSARSCSGYEISFKATTTAAAYVIIVRWNGPLNDFVYLKRLDGSRYGVKNGDVVKATIVGNVITAYINGAQVATATDSMFTKGNPGMGFNFDCSRRCQGTNQGYGFTRFTASDEEKEALPLTKP
jgi:hypothetical protein